MWHIIFAVAVVEIMEGVATCGEGGGRAGSSYELDAAQSIQSKIFSIFFTFRAASNGRHMSLPNSSFC